MRSFFTRTIVGAAATMLFASGASGAYVCHPDPAGTRTLSVRGEVTQYALKRGRAQIEVAWDGVCRRVIWAIRLGRVSSQRVACAAPAIQGVSASDGSVHVDAQRGGTDSPDRLIIRGLGAPRSWPMPVRVSSLDVHKNIAVFAGGGVREAYAVDLRTGVAGIVGLVKRRDAPQIDRGGVLFRDNVYKENESTGATLMKYIPLAHVRSIVSRVVPPLRLRGRVVGLSMDSGRVALAVRNWKGGCDAVVFWNVSWRYAVPITEADEHTCAWSQRGATITSVAIGGLRAMWTMRVGRTQRVLSASSVDCFERIVARADAAAGERVVGVVGDGGLLAYGVQRGDTETIGRLDERMRGRVVAADAEPSARLAAEGSTIARVLPNGDVELRSSEGSVTRVVNGANARAIALRGEHLVVLSRRGTLDVFNRATTERLSSWRAPNGARSLDSHYGVAVVVVGRRIYAISLKTGRRAVVGSAPSAVHAQIEEPGIVFAYQSGGRSEARFVPFARIERLLGSAIG